MSTVFNADDIFEMAEQIERNGAKFYRNAADKISDASAKELLLTFARMEEQHEITFADYRAELTRQEKENTAFDPDDESVLYLRALADLRVFKGKKAPDDTSRESRSQKEILEDIFSSAIQAEKDSIIFYVGMQDLVPENLGKTRLDNIIKEEMNHIRILTKELEKALA